MAREAGVPENSKFNTMKEYLAHKEKEESTKVDNLQNNLGSNWQDVTDDNGKYLPGKSYLDGSHYQEGGKWYGMGYNGHGGSGSSSGGGSSGGGGSSYTNALRRAIAENVKLMQQQKGTVGSEYDDMAAENYVTYRQNKEALPGQLMGMADGATESAKLANNANYQNNNSDTLRDKQNALNSIDAQISGYKASGDMQLAQAVQQQVALAEAKALEQQKLQQEQTAQYNYTPVVNDSQSMWGDKNNNNYNTNDETENKNQSIMTDEEIARFARIYGISETDVVGLVQQNQWQAFLNGNR